MTGLEYVNHYMSLSINNPLFKKNYDKILLTLNSVRRDGTIDEATYQQYLERLTNKFGNLRLELERVFDFFKTITTTGFFNLTFNESEFRLLLEARKTCADFYSWADPNRHLENNPALLSYLNWMGQKYIEARKENKEEKWDYFNMLRSAIVTVISRGMVYRSNIETLVKITALAIREEEIILEKDKESEGLKSANAFGDDSVSVAKELYDAPAIAYEMFMLFGTDLLKFREKSRVYQDYLTKLKNDGKISITQHRELKFHLDSYTIHLGMNSMTSDREPIIAYMVCKQKGDMSEMLLFSREEIEAAIEIASDVYRDLTDEFLVDELVFQRLRVDLSQFGSNPVTVKDYYKKDLTKYLNLLRAYDVISLEDYRRYSELGRSKFG